MAGQIAERTFALSESHKRWVSYAGSRHLHAETDLRCVYPGYQQSIKADLGLSCDTSPFVVLGFDERGELIRRIADRLRAQGREAQMNLGRLQRAYHFGIQAAYSISTSIGH